MSRIRVLWAASVVVVVLAGVPAFADAPKAGQMYECLTDPTFRPVAGLRLTSPSAYAVGAWRRGKVKGPLKKGTYSLHGTTFRFLTGPYKRYWAFVQHSGGYRKGTLDLALQTKAPMSPPRYDFAGIDCFVAK